MTIEEVQAKVEEIRENAGDPELAHSREDDLYLEVLRAVADGHPDSQELARRALLTKSVRFSRHCA